MFGELDSYTIAQFIPFTREVYFRLFERLNEAVWPWQLVLLAVLAAVPVLIRRDLGLLAGPVLALSWIWVATWFHFRLYAELNWAAGYLGWLFLIQAGLILVAGVRGRLSWGGGLRACIGTGLFGFAVAVLPLLGPLFGRSWAGMEVAGTAPDPTAVATLGILLLPARVPWLLVPAPIIWCAYSAASFWALGWLPGLVLIAAVVLFALSCLTPAGSSGSAPGSRA